MSTHLTTKLDSMMQIVEGYEKDPKKLRIERLVELHRDLFEGYSLIASDAEHVRSMDRRLDHYFRTSEVGGSTLRSTLLQLHATWFYFRAGAPVGVSDAYNKARELRGRTADEGPYFRQVLIPQILDPINTVMPPRVRLELIAIIARLENDTEVDPIFADDASDQALHEIPRAQFILGLVRRWESAGRTPLTEKGHTAENRLFHQGRLDSMAREDPVIRGILGPQGLGYIQLPPFWIRILKALRRAFTWFVALLENVPGVITRPVLYTLVGLFWILLAIGGFAAVRWDNERMMVRVQALKELTGSAKPVERPVEKEVEPPVREVIVVDDTPEIERARSAVQDQLDTLKEKPIDFDEGRSALSEFGKGQLYQIAIVFNRHAKYWSRLEVVGFTDSIGSDATNMELSRKRAAAVVDYLVEQGLPSDRLSSEGLGESSEFDNSTAEGRRKNRRIEFRTTWNRSE